MTVPDSYDTEKHDISICTYCIRIEMDIKMQNSMSTSSKILFKPLQYVTAKWEPRKWEPS